MASALSELAFYLTEGKPRRGPQLGLKNLVYNFRSDGRQFSSNRCLIVADGFYEFTDGAILDRLTHHVHILEMNGGSFRLRQSRKRNP